MALTYVVHGVISAHNEEFKFHSLVGTFGDEHVFRPSTTAIFVSVLGTTFASLQLVECVSVGKGDTRISSITVDDVLTRSNYWKRNNCKLTSDG